jgi:hypothetical protein
MFNFDISAVYPYMFDQWPCFLIIFNDGSRSWLNFAPTHSDFVAPINSYSDYAGAKRYDNRKYGD